ncbi:putative uncharacterized protein DDB_G0289963 [Diaphorina citri]|uniref:Uncharacterized protein n=1 Tax=Diaphorina citri TaxID=121845 RepID=A0A3Q0J554_DIACI|nr:putative uncharacterized protein DDB_G0289963 [Diaphorina citri]
MAEEDADNRTNCIEIPGSSNHGTVIENSYKRSECVENVEKALNDAFNEFHLSSSCTENFLSDQGEGNPSNELITIPGNAIQGNDQSLVSLLTDDSGDKELSASSSDVAFTNGPTITDQNNPSNIFITNKTNKQMDRESAIFPLDMKDKDLNKASLSSNPISLSNEDHVQSSTDMNSSRDVAQTISQPSIDPGETTINEKSHPTISKSDMKLKLTNSNEYLQLIFSPSPMNENEMNENEHMPSEKSRHNCDIASGDSEQANRNKSNSKLIDNKDNITPHCANESNNFIDIKNVRAEDMNDKAVDSSKTNQT